MFYQNSRRLFRNNPLLEVICQLRFPQILSIGARVPVDFQEAIRDEFPKYTVQKEVPAPKITGAPGNFSLQNQPEVINYQFASSDNTWRVNLTNGFISLACSRYTQWEDFAKKLDKPLASFIQIYKPAYFERVGLRYINAFSRKALGLEGVPFRELFQSCYLGVLAEEDVEESSTARCSTDLEMSLRGGCRLKLHAGPGMIKRPGVNDPEVRFILDNDLFMSGNIPVNLSAGAMQTLHQHADSLFLGAVTQRTLDAMEPLEYLKGGINLFFDWTYVYLVLPAVLLAMWASGNVQRTFQRYANQHSRRGLTGAQAARRVLDANHLQHISIVQVSGTLTDHYDPKANVIRLSDGVYGSDSTAAIGVACHEAGHAVQYAVGYAPIRLRAAIVPITNIGSRLSMPLILLGLLLSGMSYWMYNLVYVGIACFALSALFQLVTLPTEFNASRRALAAIESGGLLYDDELAGAKKTLRAAALTYVAALAVSVTQLLRLLLLFGGRSRRQD